MSIPRAGIVGIGSVRGAEERLNSWWPQAIVDSWRPSLSARKADLRAALEGEERPTRRLVMEHMLATVDDPFNGLTSRSIYDAKAPIAEFEAAAARDALERANIDAGEVDVLITHSFLPDMLATNVATSVHHALGLRARCLTLGMEGASNSFSHQLSLAEGLLLSGRARTVLLVQSTTPNRLIPRELPYSTWFGEVATAAVVRLVDDGTGLIGIAHTADGSVQGSLLAGAPERPWHAGPAILYPGNPRIQGPVFYRTFESCQEVVTMALANTGTDIASIDFYGCHLAFQWLTPATRDALGLTHTKGVDIFAQNGNLVSCGVPYQMGHAAQTKVLARGDLCLFWSGGAGMTNSAIVLRWSIG